MTHAIYMPNMHQARQQIGDFYLLKERNFFKHNTLHRFSTKSTSTLNSIIRVSKTFLNE
jgi:hypothetical protein